MSSRWTNPVSQNIQKGRQLAAFFCCKTVEYLEDQESLSPHKFGYLRRMRNSLLLLISLLSTATLFGQVDSVFVAEYGLKKEVLGFVGGLEFGMLGATGEDLSGTPFQSIEKDAGVGLSLGVTTHFFISEGLALRPQASISVLRNKFRYFYPNGRYETYFVYPFSGDIAAHLMIRNPLYKKRLGFFIGPAAEFLIPVANTSRPAVSEYLLRGDAGISIPVDLGIGHYLLDLGYSVTLNDMLIGETIYESPLTQVYRQRVYVRVSIY